MSLRASSAPERTDLTVRRAAGALTRLTLPSAARTVRGRLGVSYSPGANNATRNRFRVVDISIAAGVGPRGLLRPDLEGAPLRTQTRQDHDVVGRMGDLQDQRRKVPDSEFLRIRCDGNVDIGNGDFLGRILNRTVPTDDPTMAA